MKKLTKFSYAFKEPWALPIFSIFGAKILIPKNLTLSCGTPHGPLTHAEFQKKLKSQFQEIFRQKDEQTLFIDRTLLAAAKGPIRE